MKRLWNALRSGSPFALAGVLATLCGMAAGHLIASLLKPASSPVLAVGSTVIDLTPTPLKEYAVREFGTKDKPILLASVMAVTLLLAAVAGLLARRWFPVGAGLLIALVALAGAAAVTRPLATASDVVPSLVAAVVGLVVLVLLVRLLNGAREPADEPAREAAEEEPAPKRSTGGPVGPSPAGGTGPFDVMSNLEPIARRKPRSKSKSAPTAAPRASRRTLLITTGLVAAASATMGWAGEKIIAYRTRIGNVNLPPAAKPIAPLPAGLENVYSGISNFQTSTDRFYRVDINLTLPVVPVDDWKLTIDGDVDNSFSLTFDELAAMPLIERDITMTCVSNEVGGRYIGAARWLGVPLTDLLDRAGVGSKADQILSTAVDGFTISTPLEVARDGRDAMVAIGMNGEPLPAEHGFPARLITPGLYGFVGATKWLTRLTLTTYDDDSAYWTDRDWATDAPIKISSRIDTPKPLATIKDGQTVIGGVAWAQRVGIKKVEVRIDGNAWQEATLGPDAGIDYWRQWYLPWDASPGQHMLAVRATSLDGEVQTAARATPFPEGSSGVQEIVVTVE
ncbi:molybdopterin-dependent oxidoreductase [Nocardioides sp. Root151]|uniref:molybdopterin-dependent oxidoreductase n=1 Tax=Nocardioides sp. Root151 TaxID=1736475 RepID=UPI0007034605|nr:molybdopterin-dependent oxidoreductase [Nocardioides sp. Root151]KQZ75979.1 oxidoreductase [Nocardioides sp. Root151]